MISNPEKGVARGWPAAEPTSVHSSMSTRLLDTLLQRLAALYVSDAAYYVGLLLIVGLLSAGVSLSLNQRW
jgi:hypothetical protein